MSHNTVNCRVKLNPQSNTCSYCKIPGHNVSECWKKAYNEKQKGNNSPKPHRVSVIHCNYCKKPGHIIKECRKLKAMKRLDSEPHHEPHSKNNPSNKEDEVRKLLQILNKNSFNQKTYAISQVPTRKKLFVELKSDFIKNNSHPFLVDTGAKVSILPIEY